jgi:hypothetical protein
MIGGRGGGGWCLASYWVRRQRPPLDGGSMLHASSVDFSWGGLLWLGGRPLRFGAVVVVGDFEANLAGVLASAGQVLPDVALTAAGDNDALEVDPGLADQIGLLVVGED